MAARKNGLVLLELERFLSSRPAHRIVVALMPSDEMSLLRDRARAASAKQLLENDLFNEALVSIERDLMAAWKASPPRDTDGRERCWTAVQQIGKLKGYFEVVLSNGSMAESQLKELADADERKKRIKV